MKFNMQKIINQVIDLKDINLNPIDRPAYVIYAYSVGGNNAMEFVFTSDKEERAKYEFNDISIEYGVNSGRIYTLFIKKNEINQTDAFHIITNSKTELSTERFKDNIKNFIAICNQTMEFAINNPI